MKNSLLIVLCLSVTLTTCTQAAKASTYETVVEYGVDVSFPVHHAVVSSNYVWLPHNSDPSLPVPDRYKGMPLQPLGNRQQAYQDYIDGCVRKCGSRGAQCLATERDRIELNLRQPRSMKVRRIVRWLLVLFNLPAYPSLISRTTRN